MKKKPKTVFGVADLLTRNWYILSLISSFLSTFFKLTKLQVEKTFLVFPGKYFSLRSKIKDTTQDSLWRKLSQGALQLFSSSLRIWECNMFFCMCCTLAFMSILVKASFESHADSRESWKKNINCTPCLIMRGNRCDYLNMQMLIQNKIMSSSWCAKCHWWKTF